MARHKRIIGMCEKLAGLGIEVHPEEVFEEAGGSESVGRPHLAKVLLKKDISHPWTKPLRGFLAMAPLAM